MKRTPLKRSTKPLRKKPRTKSEKLRIYGPPGFIEWIHEQRCIACGQIPSQDYPSHAAHTETGGVSRKGDWTSIVPLCFACHILIGHQSGNKTLEALWDIDLEVAAIAIQEQWASHTDRLP